MAVSTRLPKTLVGLADEDAKRRGLDRTAIVTEALAEKYGRLDFFDVQEQLPLTDAA